MYLHVAWKGQIITETLCQIIHRSNTNNVKFLSCHRNKDADSSLSFSKMTQYFTKGSSFPELRRLLFKMIKLCHKQYLTITAFNIFTHALML